MCNSNEMLMEYQLGEFGEFNKSVVTEGAKIILDKYKQSGKDEIVFVNIGTDRVIGDMFAPMLGSFLEEKNCMFEVYGTLEDPIHAKTLNDKLYMINKKHSNAFIVGIDSCVGETLYNFKIKNSPIRPGRGMGKELATVGDIGMTLTTVSCASDLFNANLTRSGVIYKAVKEVYRIIQKLEVYCLPEKWENDLESLL